MNSKHGRQEHWTNLEKYHRVKIKERRIRKAGKESRKEESRIRVSRKIYTTLARSQMNDCEFQISLKSERCDH